MHPNDPNLPAELEEVARGLEADRPVATPGEMDRMYSRTQSKAARRRASTGLKGTLLKSRIALTTMLVLGVLVSGTGGALALSGDAGSGSAARSQYCPPGSQNAQGGKNSNSNNATGRRCGQQDVAGESESNSQTLGGGAGGNSGDGDVQASRQTGTGGGDLPFTGYAAVPIILLGLALLGASILLRREARALPRRLG